MNASLEPQVKVSTPEACRCRLDIEIPAATINNALKMSLISYSKEASIPGFRAGKVPQNLIQRKFAAQIQERAKEYLLYQTLQEACDKNGLEPETAPIFEDGMTLSKIILTENQDLTIAISFDVAPTFELPDYKAISVEKGDVAVEDEAVQDVVKGLLQQRVSYEAVTDRAAIKDDLLKLSYSATLTEEVEVSENAKFILKAEHTWLPLNDQEMIPGATTALIGAEAGKSYDLAVTFPENYFEKSLAGKTANYKFEIEEIQASIVPELTDDLAKQFGVEDAEGLQANIRQHLLDEKTYQSDMSFREKVAQAVIEGMTFELPPETLEETTNTEANRMFQAEIQKKTADINEKIPEIKEQAKERAINILRRRYVFKKISEIENLKVNSEDIDAVIESLANYAKTTPAKMKQHLQKNNRMNELFSNIRESKAIDFIATSIEERSK